MTRVREDPFYDVELCFMATCYFSVQFYHIILGLLLLLSNHVAAQQFEEYDQPIPPMTLDCSNFLRAV